MSSNTTNQTNATQAVEVWDLPLRLFHWLLVLGIAAAYITSELGGNVAEWHGRIGIFVLGLLIFRLLWGFIGSAHSRFSSFIPTPKAIVAYFRGEWRGAGHTPLGALAVYALLLAVGVQVGTGLFVSDDITFDGPLHNLVDRSTSDALAGLHARNFNMLLGLIGLHVAAILAYAIFKRTNLVKPMLTGKKELDEAPATTRAPAQPLRFIVAAVLSAGIAWAVFNVPAKLLPSAAPPPPAPIEAPW